MPFGGGEFNQEGGQSWGNSDWGLFSGDGFSQREEQSIAEDWFRRSRKRTERGQIDSLAQEGIQIESDNHLRIAGLSASVLRST